MTRLFACIIIGTLLLSTVPAFSLPAQAQSSPTIQDVGITFWDYSVCLVGPITASTGGKLRLWYYIVNPDSASMQLILGATLRDSDGGIIEDPSNDKLVTVDPGGSYYSRFFDIPISAKLDMYDVAYGIWEHDWSVQYSVVWKDNWLTVTDPVALTLSSRTLDGTQVNIGNIVFDDITYSPSTVVYAQTRMYAIQAIPPSGFLFDHWEYSEQTPISEEEYGYANAYVHGSGELKAVFQMGPSFDLAAGNPSPRITPGSEVDIPVVLISQVGFTGWIDLSFGWPGGRPTWVNDDSLSIDPVYLEAGTSASLTLAISLSNDAVPGLYYPVLTATSGNQLREVKIAISVPRLCHVTFDTFDAAIVVDSQTFVKGIVSYYWWNDQPHYAHMISPYTGEENFGWTLVFRQWTDGNTYWTVNQVIWGGGQNQPSGATDVTYRPLYYRYAHMSISAGYGGTASMSPTSGPNGYLEGTFVSFSAFPASGYVLDHWEENPRGVPHGYTVPPIIWPPSNPLVIPVVPADFKAVFKVPGTDPVVILSIQGGGSTFHVGEVVTFSGLESQPPLNGVIFDYYFDYGDGHNSGWVSSGTSTHAYTTIGDYSARLMLSTSSSSGSSWSTPILVHIISAGDFEISSVSPETQITPPDSSVNYQITISSKNGFSSSVTLDASFSPSPGHIGWTFDPAVVTLPPNGEAFSTLKVNVYEDTPPNVFTIAIVAKSGDITKLPVDVTLNIEKILEVPYQNQGDTEWCGPTSLTMVLRYYGVSFHSWQYTDPSTDLPLPSWGGLLGVDAMENYVSKHYPWLISVEGSYLTSEQARDRIFYDIESNITANFPVILKLYNPGKNHFIVVTGFNGSGIFINDPSGAVFSTAYLNLPSVTNFNHAFLSWTNWEGLKQFIHPLYAVGADFLSLHGTSPQPSSGTLYLMDGGIEFRNPSNPLDDYFFLDLDWGLTWKSYFNGESEPNPTLSSKDSQLYWTVYSSNTKKASDSFTLSAYIIGEDGSQYNLDDQSVFIAAFGEAGRIWSVSDFVLPKSQLYHIVLNLWDSYGYLTDTISSPDFYYLKLDVSLRLKEQQQHLYLHVYDSQGNHVGLDYATGQPELEIPDSYYYDDGNGTIVIVVPQIMNLTIVVDARFAEDPIESYDLTVLSETDLGSSVQTYAGTIAQGMTDTHHLYVPPNETPIIDDAPPSTKLAIGNPTYVGQAGTYVTNNTSFTLLADDGAGSGIAEIAYRVKTNGYDTGWVPYTSPFRLVTLTDGGYTLFYNSTDNAGNIEKSNSVTLVVDNTRPSTNLAIGDPKYAAATSTFVTAYTSFTLSSNDGSGSGVASVFYRIWNDAYNSGWQTYSGPFYLATLAKENYTISYYSADNLGNKEAEHTVKIVLFSWTYVFQDSYGRGTKLEICTQYGLFDFIVPGKDFGIKYDSHITLLKSVIMIGYQDTTMSVIAVAAYRTGVCAATVWDKQANKMYLLVSTRARDKQIQ